jgi:hypothetical protein
LRVDAVLFAVVLSGGDTPRILLDIRVYLLPFLLEFLTLMPVNLDERFDGLRIVAAVLVLDLEPGEFLLFLLLGAGTF